MTIVTVRVDLPDSLTAIVKHTLLLLERHFELTLKFQKDNADLTIAAEGNGDIAISKILIRAFDRQAFENHLVFKSEPLIYFEDGTPDYLGTCVYMVNYLQEYVPDSYFDHLNRFKYEHSYQKRFGCADKNLVLIYFTSMVKSNIKLRKLRAKQRNSQVFVSHDVDILVKSIWPDLKTASKNLDLLSIIKLLFYESYLDQDNKLFDKINGINWDHQTKATFFWMVNRHPFRTKTGELIANANYDIQKTNHHVRRLQDLGHQIGLHQSLGSTGLAEEISQLKCPITANRNHYLHGKLPNIWEACDDAGIKFDCSAGFSNQIGFRNSYGLPTRPFSLKSNQPFRVVEVPLQIMDVTMMKEGFERSTERVFDFIANSKSDCLLSILWHNNYFSTIKFNDSITVYKRLLAKCKEFDLEFIHLSDLDGSDYHF